MNESSAVAVAESSDDSIDELRKRAEIAETEAAFYKASYEGAGQAGPFGRYAGLTHLKVGELRRIHYVNVWNANEIIETQASWGGGEWWITPDGKKYRAAHVRVLD